MDWSGWLLETEVEKELQVQGTKGKNRAWGRTVQHSVSTDIRGSRLEGLDVAVRWFQRCGGLLKVEMEHELSAEE